MVLNYQARAKERQVSLFSLIVSSYSQYCFTNNVTNSDTFDLYCQKSFLLSTDILLRCINTKKHFCSLRSVDLPVNQSFSKDYCFLNKIFYTNSKSHIFLTNSLDKLYKSFNVSTFTRTVDRSLVRQSYRRTVSIITTHLRPEDIDPIFTREKVEKCATKIIVTSKQIERII